MATASLAATSVAGATPAGSTRSPHGHHGSVRSGPASPSGIRSHIVSRGDTVPSIAKRYGVSADDIRAANGIVDDRLYRGARLLIDGSASSATASTSSSGSDSDSDSSSSRGAVSTTAGRTTRATTYEVKDGDVLERIARDHGISLRELLDANDMEATSLILDGDTLDIPSSRSSGNDSGNSRDSGNSKDSDSNDSGSKDSSSRSGRPAGATGPSLRCPVPGASFMNDWGFPRDGGTRFHEGTDLFAPKGTTILAPAAGVISYGSNPLGGSTFSLTTDDGWVIYGAHLSKTIGSSRQVGAGEAIARVGNSGDANGGDPHLHVGLKRAGGRPMNPYPSMLDACR